MFTVKQAMEAVLSKEKGMQIATVFDIDHSYVITVMADNGDIPDDAPWAVNKESGELSVFSVERYMKEFVNAKEIDIRRILLQDWR